MNELKAHEAGIAPYPVQNWLTGRMKPAATSQGRTDLMSLWSGQAAPLLRHKEASLLMQALQRQTDDALQRAFHHTA